MSAERLRRLRAAIVEYEQEFGEITAEEIAHQERSDRSDAPVVRGSRRWMGKGEFVATVLAHQADSALDDDLDVVSGEIIDEER